MIGITNGRGNNTPARSTKGQLSMTNKVSTSKWKDPEFRKKYGKKWRDDQKAAIAAGLSNPITVSDEKPLTPWKQRQMEKRAKEEANSVRPLMLPFCPQCGAEFLRRIGGKLEQMKLSYCPSCELRYYYAGKLY